MGKIQEGRRGKTKADLVDAVYLRHGGLTKTEAARIVETIFDKVKGTLAKGGNVKITNFGTFAVTQRSARRGVNPANGEPIEIPAHKGLSFRPARRLRDGVSRSSPASSRASGSRTPES